MLGAETRSARSRFARSGRGARAGNNRTGAGHVGGVTDHGDFEAAYAAHYDVLMRYALRRVTDPSDAADVVAETWTVAWRRRSELPGGNENRLWLFGIARLVLANQRRGQLRRTQLTERLRAELRTTSPVTPIQENPVSRALAHLRPADRDLLAMQVWDGLTTAEMATVLHCGTAAIRVRLHRARARLRTALDHPPPPHPALMGDQIRVLEPNGNPGGHR